MNRDWHRLVGKGLSDVLAGWPFRVIQEVDLSLRRCRLDFALIRLSAGSSEVVADPACEPKDWRWPDLPDGLTDLSEHNLITYRAPGDPLKQATLWELTGYMVDYLKLEYRGDWDPLRASPELEKSVESRAEDEGRAARETFIDRCVASRRLRLYCISSHRPEWLEGVVPALVDRTAAQGVFDLDAGFGLPVRLIIPREVNRSPRNALWNVLSGNEELIQYGLSHFQAKDRALHSLFCKEVADCYSKEGIRLMAITSDDYRREAREMLLAEATPEERLRGLDPEQRLKGLDPEQRLKGLDPEQRLKGLDPEERLKGLDPEQRLRGLDREQALRILFPEASDEQIRAMLRQAQS